MHDQTSHLSALMLCSHTLLGHTTVSLCPPHVFKSRGLSITHTQECTFYTFLRISRRLGSVVVSMCVLARAIAYSSIRKAKEAGHDMHGDRSVLNYFVCCLQATPLSFTLFQTHFRVIVSVRITRASALSPLGPVTRTVLARARIWLLSFQVPFHSLHRCLSFLT